MKILLLAMFLFLVGGSDVYCEMAKNSYGTVDITPLSPVNKSIVDWKSEANKIDESKLSYPDLALLVLTNMFIEVFDGYLYDIEENAEGYTDAIKQDLSRLCQIRMYEMYATLLPFVKSIGEQSKDPVLLLRNTASDQGLRVLLNNAVKVLVQFNAALANMIKEAEVITSAATASGDGG